jgi:pSer/pThr/pTyr-binding forkhead associated (FHA) protein
MLNADISEAPTTRRIEDSFELSEELKEQITREHTPPSRGLSLFLLNKSEPIALRTEAEFVLGRAGDSTSEAVVDLTDHDGFALGVSRRHAQIRAAGEKYVLTDLNSSNGTWLNGQRLVPTRPYDLPSGGVIQLGRIKLVVVYMKPAGPKEKK